MRPRRPDPHLPLEGRLAQPCCPVHCQVLLGASEAAVNWVQVLADRRISVLAESAAGEEACLPQRWGQAHPHFQLVWPSLSASRRSLPSVVYSDHAAQSEGESCSPSWPTSWRPVIDSGGALRTRADEPKWLWEDRRLNLIASIVAFASGGPNIFRGCLLPTVHLALDIALPALGLPSALREPDGQPERGGPVKLVVVAAEPPI